MLLRECSVHSNCQSYQCVTARLPRFCLPSSLSLSLCVSLSIFLSLSLSLSSSLFFSVSFTVSGCLCLSLCLSLPSSFSLCLSRPQSLSFADYIKVNVVWRHLSNMACLVDVTILFKLSKKISMYKNWRLKSTNKFSYLRDFF